MIQNKLLYHYNLLLLLLFEWFGAQNDSIQIENKVGRKNQQLKKNPIQNHWVQCNVVENENELVYINDNDDDDGSIGDCNTFMILM